MPELLQKRKYDMAFNFVDTVKGSDSMSATIPGVLELLDIPYTGSGMLGISLSTNKFLMDNLLDASGIPTARHHLFNSASEYIPTDLRYPLISKLNETHGSIEISDLAISQNEQQLRERLRYLITTYKEPVLVEEFIAGRELSALYFESKVRKVYIVEKVFSSENPNEIMSFDLKWISEDETIHTHSKYNDDQLIELVKKAAQVAHISDYGRFDIRLDISGRYHFIDTNPNPFFNPLSEGSLMTSILDIHGISFEETLKRIIANTLL
ncbi:hypothetical protein KC573_02505 [candidate division WWE3 bacterium]|uniref:ATP-grasp domain-containing protein n=1 Tax=candidate division WWE3 bacterium TaxID=2053526 RepID=A0A955RWW9_UNCKA|nr:hypothetical protein [candidate division WWE3 bacterium]